MTPAEAAQVLRGMGVYAKAPWLFLPGGAANKHSVTFVSFPEGYSPDQLQAIAMWMREPSILKGEK